MPAEADTSAPPPPPITIYFHKNCSGGQLIDSSRLPATCEDTSVSGLAKKFIQVCVRFMNLFMNEQLRNELHYCKKQNGIFHQLLCLQELLAASPKPDTLLSRLGTLRGEEMAITHDGNTYNIKLPTINKPNDFTAVFTAVATAINICPQIFGKSSK